MALGHHVRSPARRANRCLVAILACVLVIAAGYFKLYERQRFLLGKGLVAFTSGRAIERNSPLLRTEVAAADEIDQTVEQAEPYPAGVRRPEYARADLDAGHPTQK